MAYTTIDKPSDYFNTKIYTGNNGSQTITGVGFQPDWVWFKSRTTTDSHYLVDSVRGNTKYIRSQTNTAEETNSTAVTSFNSDGYALGSAGNVNDNANYVSWNWKASGTNISNSSGSNGATLASAGIKNDTAGISIVTYTGDGNARTVFHGLSSCDMVIHKCLNNAENWGVQHKDIGAAYQLQLDTTIAKVDKSGNGSMALPASNVFSVNNSGQWGASRNYIAYAFRSVQGYSKFGSYIGNGNADGTFVYTGFKPSFVIRKKSSGAESWQMHDNKRDTFNVVYHRLLAEDSGSEYTSASNQLDFTAQGFKMRATNDGGNASGGTYIYMAFAESPFVNSNKVPNNAR